MGGYQKELLAEESYHSSCNARISWKLNNRRYESWIDKQQKERQLEH